MGSCKCTRTRKLFVAGISDLILGVAGLIICFYLLLNDVSLNLDCGEDEYAYPNLGRFKQTEPIRNWQEKLTEPDYYKPILLCILITITDILTIYAICCKSNSCAIIALVGRVLWALIWIYVSLFCIHAYLVNGLSTHNKILRAIITIGIPVGYTTAQFLMIYALFYYWNTELKEKKGRVF